MKGIRALISLFRPSTIISWNFIFALREVNGYTNTVVTLRRGGDNVTQVFYQGATAGSLNTTRGGGGTDALTWVSAGGGNGNGYVQVLPDQGGSGNYLQQTTYANQYQIIASGAYLTLGPNNRPALYSAGSAYMTFNTNVDLGSGDYTIIDVKRLPVGNPQSITIANSGGVRPHSAFLFSDGNTYMSNNAVYAYVASSDPDVAHTFVCKDRSGTKYMRKDTVAQSLTVSAGGSGSVANCIGLWNTSTYGYGYLGEMWIQVGAAIDESAVESNVRTYFAT